MSSAGAASRFLRGFCSRHPHLWPTVFCLGAAAASALLLKDVLHCKMSLPGVLPSGLMPLQTLLIECSLFIFAAAGFFKLHSHPVPKGWRISRALLHVGVTVVIVTGSVATIMFLQLGAREKFIWVTTLTTEAAIIYGAQLKQFQTMVELRETELKQEAKLAANAGNKAEEIDQFLGPMAGGSGSSQD